MKKLRLLNFDDLFLLKLLLEDTKVTAVADRLGLTQPAVTQRVRKIEKVFQSTILQKAGRRVRLTEEGRSICNRAVAALSLMGEVSLEPSSQVVNIGTRPEAGWSWLWPAIDQLRAQKPDTVFHCFFGSGEEILQSMGMGKLDSVLTSAPATVREYRAIDIAEETYVFVAVPEIAQSIKGLSCLERFTILEHDRSFPFHRYVDAHSRAGMRYRDVWFLGSTNLMMEAVTRGHGVAIVPEYLARYQLESGKLNVILPEVRIEPDYFRLIYRQDRNIDESMEFLGQALRKIGLR